MNYIYSPFLYDGKPQDREELAMSKSQDIDAILERVQERRGIKTKAQNEREHAVQVLAGKKPAQKPLRPGVRELLDGGR